MPTSVYSPLVRWVPVTVLAVVCCSCGSTRVPPERALSVANQFAAATVRRDCAAEHRLSDATTQLGFPCPGNDILHSINAYVPARRAAHVLACPRKLFHAEAQCVQVALIGRDPNGAWESASLIVGVAHRHGQDIVVGDVGSTGICTLDCPQDEADWARRAR